MGLSICTFVFIDFRPDQTMPRVYLILSSVITCGILDKPYKEPRIEKVSAACKASTLSPVLFLLYQNMKVYLALFLRVEYIQKPIIEYADSILLTTHIKEI